MFISFRNMQLFKSWILIKQLRFCTFQHTNSCNVNFILGLFWLAPMKKKYKDFIMKYEGRKTHGRDKLYVRGGGGGKL